MKDEFSGLFIGYEKSPPISLSQIHYDVASLARSVCLFTECRFYS
jgi:hypothetical protein